MARLLDVAGIPYSLVPYQVDESDLAAAHVAEQLGEPLEQVFKTLVLRGDKNGIFVCVMPGDMEIDLKVAARISGRGAEKLGVKLFAVLKEEQKTKGKTSAKDVAGKAVKSATTTAMRKLTRSILGNLLK